MRPRSNGSSAAAVAPSGLHRKTFPNPSAICAWLFRFGAAHCALEYQRWAARSQLRDEGRRFMRSMCQQLSVPLLHLRGDADPYVLADPVDRTQRYAPQGRYVSISGAGHFSHEEAPGEINRNLTTFLEYVHGPRVS